MNEIDFNVINEMCPLKVKNEGNNHRFTGVFFESLLKEKANDHEPWSYGELNGEKITFGPRDIRWSNGTIIKAHPNDATGSIDKTNMRYHGAFGAGFNVEITQNNYVWRKTIEIPSLESLGEIPDNATYLEIRFDMGGNVNIPEGFITNDIAFGTKSIMHQIRLWESSENNDSIYIDGEIKNNILSKRIPVDILKEAVYPIQTDITITYGVENCFNTAATNHISVAALDSTHFVVAYEDAVDTDGYGCARVGSISGTTITYGTENCFEATTNTTYISVAALDSTRFVVAYRSGSYGRAKVGLVSGTTISSYGTENDFNLTYTNNTSVAALDSTHFVVVYKDYSGDTYGHARIGLVSGTTISSYGAENCFNSAETEDISVAAIDSTHFVVAYIDDGGSNYGCARVGLVSGTTISSYGAENCFNSAYTRYTSVAALDSTHFVVVYGKDSVIKGGARIGLVSGTTISSYGTENCFNNFKSYYNSVTNLDNTTFVVTSAELGGSSYGHSRIGIVSGTTITYGIDKIFNSVYTRYTSVSALDSNYFMVAYEDDGGSDYGCARVGIYWDFTPQINIT